MTFKSKLKIASAMAVVALAGAGGVAHAAGITNGNFTGGATFFPGYNATPLTNNPNYSPAFEDTLTGWTAHGYAFVFDSPSTSPGIGALNLKSLTAPPGGENFVGIDPAFANPSGSPPVASGIAQTLTGLTSGATYALTFQWAGAQQSGFTGATTEWWLVDFGGASQQSTSHTAVGNNSGNTNPAFSGWFNTTFDFVASGASEVITFLAEGTGTAEQPPFDLLANVSLTQITVPEPASIALFGAGMVGLGSLAARRRKKK